VGLLDTLDNLIFELEVEVLLLLQIDCVLVAELVDQQVCQLLTLVVASGGVVGGSTCLLGFGVQGGSY